MSIMGELSFFLGFRIQQTPCGTFIHQSKYTNELLKRFGFEIVKAKSTPMSTATKLDKDESGNSVDIKCYRGMIGSLLYLTASRLVILFAVCLCARFQADPKESHMNALKRIFAYLKDSHDYGLFYSKNGDFFYANKE